MDLRNPYLPHTGLMGFCRPWNRARHLYVMLREGAKLCQVSYLEARLNFDEG
jgi:hypothetical protein